MVKSADRVIRILEIIGLSNDGLTHGEIAAELNIPRGSLSKLLSTLVTREYLSVDGKRKFYRLGPQLLALTGRYLSSLDVVELGRPIINELMQTTNESTDLTILKGHEVMVVCKADCSRSFIRSISIGDTFPVYATAGGKAILAYLSDEEIDRCLSSIELTPLTKKTITDSKVLRQELEKVRATGIASTRGELFEELNVMAAPVFDALGKILASITISTPTSRFTPSKAGPIKNALSHASAELSYHLGFSNNSFKAIRSGTPVTVKKLSSSL
jgi:DNA-binding IclR family transcriptional regulator